MIPKTQLSSPKFLKSAKKNKPVPIAFIIASRYFFSKSKQSIINLINFISIGVITVATASLFIVLSAFSGLKAFGLSFSNAFDPDVRIEAVEGKTLQLDSIQLNALRSIPNVAGIAPIVEEKVFLQFRDKSHVGVLRGVDKNYATIVGIDSLMVSGNWFTNDFDEVVIGSGIAKALSLGVYDYSDLLTMTVPKRKSTAGLGQNPFNKETALVTGIFLANEEIDKTYLFARLDLAQRLLQRSPTEFNSIEIKLATESTLGPLEKKVRAALKQPVKIRTRAQLNAALYKMLNTENVVVYLIFSLVIIIALFNVIGALVMMFLEKKPQLGIFYAMGLLPREIQRIFFYLGGLISWVGGILGIVLGTLLVLTQYYFPFLYIPGTQLPYPVQFTLSNFMIVCATLLVLGALAAFWATRKMDKQLFR